MGSQLPRAEAVCGGWGRGGGGGEEGGGRGGGHSLAISPKLANSMGSSSAQWTSSLKSHTPPLTLLTTGLNGDGGGLGDLGGGYGMVRAGGGRGEAAAWRGGEGEGG